MSYEWGNCPQELKDFVFDSLNKMINIIEEQPVGIYLHGSLAMGGFNLHRSDIDLIVVTKLPLSIRKKQELTHFFLEQSNKPFPIEISSLTLTQLESQQHPTPYDFHFSEFWRERYETELLDYINGEEKTDGDLAAHFTILNHRGICLKGRPIHEIFPSVPPQDYLSSILEDYEECLEKIHKNPVYSLLNLIRVYWYLKEGQICSKEEAGVWGQQHLPQEFGLLVQQVTKAYETDRANKVFLEKDLIAARDYLKKQVESLLVTKN